MLWWATSSVNAAVRVLLPCPDSARVRVLAPFGSVAPSARGPRAVGSLRGPIGMSASKYKT